MKLSWLIESGKTMVIEKMKLCAIGDTPVWQI